MEFPGISLYAFITKKEAKIYFDLRKDWEAQSGSHPKIIGIWNKRRSKPGRQQQVSVVAKQKPVSKPAWSFARRDPVSRAWGRVCWRLAWLIFSCPGGSSSTRDPSAWIWRRRVEVDGNREIWDSLDCCPQHQTLNKHRNLDSLLQRISTLYWKGQKILK